MSSNAVEAPTETVIRSNCASKKRSNAEWANSDLNHLETFRVARSTRFPGVRLA